MDGIQDCGSGAVAVSAASGNMSGNELTAKASVVDASGTTVRIGGGARREPFLTSSLRAASTPRPKGATSTRLLSRSGKSSRAI